MSTISNITVPDLVAQFHAAEKSFPAGTSAIKKNAISSFESLGFPTIKHEEWKYTNLANLFTNKFFTESKEIISENDITPFIPTDTELNVLVFINGKYNSAFSKTDFLPKGVIAGNIADHISHPAVQKYLGNVAQTVKESFVALNTAMFLQGAFVYVPSNVNSEIPVHLVFINDAGANPIVSYPRNLVIAASGSSVKISESNYSLNTPNASFTNAVTEICVEQNANVEYCKNQSESNNDFRIDYTSAILHKDSNLNIHTITTGGKIVRNNLNILLDDRNASVHLNGLYITKSESHIDNHSFVDHKSPDCYSNELYKGVLGEKSTGVFNGKIFVRRDAQKTNAYQSNKNILLTNDATVYTKPQLEIYADDVKCSHGATTGQLDEEALFYLRSRGIGIEKARTLLTIAFAEEILERITITSVREKLEELIIDRLKGM